MITKFIVFTVLIAIKTILLAFIFSDKLTDLWNKAAKNAERTHHRVLTTQQTQQEALHTSLVLQTQPEEEEAVEEQEEAQEAVEEVELEQELGGGLRQAAGLEKVARAHPKGLVNLARHVLAVSLIRESCKQRGLPRGSGGLRVADCLQGAAMQGKMRFAGFEGAEEVQSAQGQLLRRSELEGDGGGSETGAMLYKTWYEDVEEKGSVYRSAEVYRSRRGARIAKKVASFLQRPVGMYSEKRRLRRLARRLRKVTAKIQRKRGVMAGALSSIEEIAE